MTRRSPRGPGIDPDSTVYLPARHTRNPTVWIFDARSDRLIARIGHARSDLRTIDAIARVCCTAKRLRLRPALRGTTPELRALLHLTGLAEALPADVPQTRPPRRR